MLEFVHGCLCLDSIANVIHVQILSSVFILEIVANYGNNYIYKIGNQ